MEIGGNRVAFVVIFLDLDFWFCEKFSDVKING